MSPFLNALYILFFLITLWMKTLMTKSHVQIFFRRHWKKVSFRSEYTQFRCSCSLDELCKLLNYEWVLKSLISWTAAASTKTRILVRTAAEVERYSNRFQQFLVCMSYFYFSLKKNFFTPQFSKRLFTHCTKKKFAWIFFRFILCAIKSEEV